MNKDDVTISLSITPTWSILKEVQEKTEKYIRKKNVSTEIIEATIMCASELVENAIKYGSAKTGHSNISFDLGIHENKIFIKVSNGIRNEHDAQNVKNHIERVKKSNDPGKLYTERLMELMENPKPGISQLGLYRIAYEGEFTLDYMYQNKILTVMASRKVV
ncbi:MAG: hypothetical protein JW807_16930 [Spirochaetes bacterium]|nr:hypothetical protein [Spirochaetota bacterium]